MAAQPASVLPKTEQGSQASAIVQTKMKSSVILPGFARENFISVLESLWESRLRPCSWHSKNVIFREELMLTLKSQQNFPSDRAASLRKPLRTCLLERVLRKLGETVLMILSSQRVLKTRESSCRKLMWICTVFPGATFPILRQKTSPLSSLRVPRLACFPALTAFWNSFLAACFSLTTPSTILFPKSAVKRQMQALGFTGKLYSTSMNLLPVLIYFWVSVMSANPLMIYTSQRDSKTGKGAESFMGQAQTAKQPHLGLSPAVEEVFYMQKMILIVYQIV